MIGFQIGILLYLCHSSLQVSTPEDDSYTAAAVEFNFNGDDRNYPKKYAKIIQEAAGKGADIIVFPQGPHTVDVPLTESLKKCSVPADCPNDYYEGLVVISKAAKDNKIYVVINLREYVDCRIKKYDMCPGKEEYRFSTNIVFDRTGAIIVRASQCHIFAEPELTASSQCSDDATFTTDFGVEFGLVIGFDVFFTKPTGVLVSRKSLTNILMSSRWYSELPFLQSIEVQKAFQTGYNISLVAAGANNFEFGNAGSGIYYNGYGALISIFQKVNSYKLLVAKVPKTPGKMPPMPNPGPITTNPADLDGLPTLTDSSLDKFITRPLKPGYQNIMISYQDIYCNITADITMGSAVQFYRYIAVVFSGVRNFGYMNTIGARACAVIACTGDDIYTCGKRFPKYNKDSFAKFCELTVIGTAPKRKIDPKTKTFDSTFFQTSVTSAFSSVPPNDVAYKDETNGQQTTYILSLKNLNTELYTFGYWGRKFSDDGKIETAPRLDNIIKSMIPPSDNSTSVTEKRPGGGFFTILSEFLGALNKIRNMVPNILRRNHTKRIHIKDLL